MESYIAASQSRSLRTIKTELEFLQDSSLITPAQVSSILALLPNSTSSTTVATNGSRTHNPSPAIIQPTPTPSPASTAPSAAMTANPWNEKQSQIQAPPPAYPASPSLGYATALYAYSPADAGDLALQPNDKITIQENMNADWARGRNERTGEEGIFPRSYVKLLDEKAGPPGLPVRNSGYGNMPVEVANGQAVNGQQGEEKNKFNEHGKKFGKKLGNAAVFGAGATIGSNLVNSIF